MVTIPTKVLVFDTQPISRLGIILMLKQLKMDFDLVQTGTYMQRDRLLGSQDFDIVILGVNRPADFVFEQLSAIRNKSVFMHDFHVSDQAVDQLISGAPGCISKQCSTKEFHRCLKEVSAGKVYICPSTKKFIKSEYISLITKTLAYEKLLKQMMI